MENLKFKIFALSASKTLGEEIARKMNTELSFCETIRFADGEMNINIPETVRGYDVFVVQSTSEPVNDHYMELLIMIDALKRASAKTINIVMPYYGYCRQDRKVMSRQPITAKLVADLLQAAGATRIIALDLHAAQIQGFFDIPIDNFGALPILVQYFKDKKVKDVVVVSPDHGGTTRARKFAIYFDAPIAIVDKRRPKPNVAEVMNIIGDVNGKNVIIVDDIIDTAGTITLASEALKKAGAKSIYVCATHPVLSGEAVKRIENSSIEELIVTDSIALVKEKQTEKIKQVSIASLLAEGLDNILTGKAVSSLFTYDSKKRY